MADPKQPSQDVMRLALTRHGMYSPLEKAAHAVPRTKGTGAEFMAEASKQAGFRPDEVADRNLKLPEGKMNKQEFLNHIQGTNMPFLVEKKLSELGDEDEQPQYSEYQLPGGRNYREILLQHAKNSSSRDGDYQSSHWEGVPNVLAHMRMSDRKTDDNKKLLHLEELQSDWHQQGRKMGYAPKGGGLHDAAEQAARKHRQLQHKLHEARLNSDSVELRMKSAPTPEQREMHKKLMDKYNRDVMDLMPQTMKAEDEALKAKMLASSSVPDAPFKKNWHELGMKHVLHHAAKHGYSGVVITPGEEQAKRWQDEGLKVHYDQKIPEYLNKFGKQFGVQVGKTSVDKGGYKVNRDSDAMPYRLESEGSPDVISRHPTAEAAWGEAEKLGAVPLHHFPITEPMRQHILTQGLPMYREGGSVDNKDKFLEGSQTPMRLYHGTGSDITEFRPDTFFSDDPQIAGMYAKSTHRAVEGSGPNIMPVHVKLKNPFIFDEAVARRQGQNFSKIIAPHASTKDRHSEALRILKERGHDGVILQNFDDIGGRQNQYIVFDPRTIKSAVGNRGTYDTNEPNINKANGGTIHKA